MGNFKFIKHFSLAMLAGLFVISCSDDDDDPTPDPDQTGKITYLVTAGDADNDLAGGNTILALDDLSTLKDITVYKNPDGLYTIDAFTQVSYNETSKAFTGYIYARGATELGSAGLRSYELVDGKMQEFGSPVTNGGFGNTGTFGKYSYAAAISTGSVIVVERNGSTITGVEKMIDMTKYEIDGTSPQITGIADRGNNQVAIAFYYSNTDKAAVALADYNMNVTNVLYDERIGASYGAWRSARYAQIGTDDDNNVYVFSGAGEKSGALRIKEGESTFDTSYEFDILAASGGYRFRKVFHISDDYFLLEFYREKDAYGNMDSSGKMAVVKMSSKSFKWITGLPDPNELPAESGTNWPAGHNGVIYLPINPTSGQPTVYAIDATTASASARLTVGENEILRAVTIIKE